MRLAITTDPYLPVPPKLYGGIERVVDFVIRGLAHKGHQITLFGHPSSDVPCRLIPYGGNGRAHELWQLASMLRKHRPDFDVLFSWGRLAALLPVLPDRTLPKIQRYCRDYVPWNSVRIAAAIAGPSLRFAGASDSVYQPAQAGTWYTQYDGIEMSRYTFVPHVDARAPLVFLGRFDRIKGAHTAIRIALRAGARLILAGNRTDDQYFNSEIAPHLNHPDVEYIGPVDDVAKNRLLGSARALLFPIEWKEAFGLVMAEAFACGTPVIGFARGSVPELIRHGLNGFVCRDEDEAVAAIPKLVQLHRAEVRADCEARFADQVIVQQFEDRLFQAIRETRSPLKERTYAAGT